MRSSVHCIDHVMGYCAYGSFQMIQRLNGAYVTYPIDDLMHILSLESHRHQC